jgi:hypothetical protein
MGTALANSKERLLAQGSRLDVVRYALNTCVRTRSLQVSISPHIDPNYPICRASTTIVASARVLSLARKPL